MTIKDIARESGYAVGTVSRVLNNHPDVSEKARKKIMEVVDKYNFRLNSNAKHLKQQAGSSIAIIVKGADNMLFASMLGQMQNDIENKGYECLIYYINENDNELEEAIQICNDRKPMGILFLGSNYRAFREQFSRIDIPCVLVTNSGKDLNYYNLSSVSTDDSEGAVAAVEYLLQLGHRNIGILGGYLDGPVAATRLDGCIKAFEKYNVSFDTKIQYEPSMFVMSYGYNAMNNLLDRMDNITAVFAMSDVMAMGAMRAIKDRGLNIPEDISVVGYDGIELTEYLVTKLTTIRQNREEIAKRSIEILIDKIENNGEAVHELIPFRLIAGESTKSL
ncbi:MAG: LacI family DNA-binding transcriptional regulator [Oscillospiraceae bacterium]|nr:LacI family DNA-binding transcriptional regulator [Oscillospiraceae bacterium]